MKRIAVFASGSGTNAENFINYFRQSDSADIALILSDNPRARVLERAAKYSVPAVVFSREDLHSGKVLDKLEKNKIDFIVLAGFLRLVPAEITRRYEKRIVNIHPALLPAYGGKGMYGMNVHRAVIEAGEQESGPHRSPRRRHTGRTGRKSPCPRIQILPPGSGRIGQRSLITPSSLLSLLFPFSAGREQYCVALPNKKLPRFSHGRKHLFI